MRLCSAMELRIRDAKYTTSIWSLVVMFIDLIKSLSNTSGNRLNTSCSCNVTIAILHVSSPGRSEMKQSAPTVLCKHINLRFHFEIEKWNKSYCYIDKNAVYYYPTHSNATSLILYLYLLVFYNLLNIIQHNIRHTNSSFSDMKLFA